MKFTIPNSIRKYLFTALLGAFLFLLPFSVGDFKSPYTFLEVHTASAVSIWDFSLDLFGLMFLQACAWVLWAGGALLQYALDFTVFNVVDQIGSGKPLGNSIDSLWKLVRDICNLAFIFGFIYVGIRTIIDPDSASTKRFLTRIIIGALLINFSLFFAKAIVDVSNFLSVQVYNSMTTGTGSLSENMANSLGVTTLFDKGKLLEVKAMPMTFYLMAGLLLLIAAFVFFAGALLLIVRFIALLFILIASPLLFAATVFPQTERYASDLWHKLLNYAFFPPIYLLLILFVLKMTSGFEKLQLANAILNTQNVASASISSMSGNAVTLLYFTLTIGLMLGALMIATSMSGKGGSMAMSFAHGVRGKTQQFLGGATLGLAARAGRGTLGRWAHNASESEALKDRASRSGLAGWTARRQLNLSRAVGDASFDARRIGGVGKKLGIGEGVKGGYKTTTEEIEEKEKKYAKSLGEVDDSDAQVTMRKDEMKNAKLNLDANKERLKLEMRSKDEKTRKTAAEALEKLEEAHLSAEQKYQQEKQRRVLGSTFRPTNDEASAAKTQLEDAKKNLKEGLAEFRKRKKEMANEPDTEKSAMEIEMAKNVIKDRVEQLKERENEYKKAMRATDGYAAVLEGSRLLTAWPKGRLVEQEKEAGQSIRKAYEKKIKKSKDDERTDKLVEAVKDIKS